MYFCKQVTACGTVEPCHVQRQGWGGVGDQCSFLGSKAGISACRELGCDSFREALCPPVVCMDLSHVHVATLLKTWDTELWGAPDLCSGSPALARVVLDSPSSLLQVERKVTGKREGSWE